MIRRMTELRLAVEPPTTYYDDPFELRVEGVPEGASVVVAAEMREVDGGIWRSSGQYRVGPRGCLEDPMRVVWSAERVLPSGPPEAGSEIALDLTVEHDSRLAAARCVRLDPSVGGGVEPDDPELAGLLYLPPGDSRHPPVLFLGGSEGGFHRRHPALLARHGFAVLSLAYFGHPRRPHLVEVPLEGFERALRWLLGHPRVEGRRAAVIGGSFGGQAAPLVAATYPALAGATVMLSGSGVVTSGIPGHPTLLDNFQDARSPWTFGGRPLDFVSGTGDEFERQCRSGGPVEMRLAFETALRDEAAVARAAIPAEAIDGPLLLLSGGDDRQWPCVAMSEVVVARRRQGGLPVEHVVYPEAGHGLVPPPYGPTTTRVLPPPFPLVMGGTAAADAVAREDAWRRVLAFLAAHAGL